MLKTREFHKPLDSGFSEDLFLSLRIGMRNIFIFIAAKRPVSPFDALKSRRERWKHYQNREKNTDTKNPSQASMLEKKTKRIVR